MVNNVYRDAEVLWDYLSLDEPTISADLLLVLGSIDDRVAVCAAELSNVHHYGLVIFSGGQAHAGDMLETSWGTTEAQHFADIFRKAAGRAEKILLEDRAEHTGQNATLTYELLLANHLANPSTIQIVTKPYMQRRARATFEAQWPDAKAKLYITSQRLRFADYPDEVQSFEMLVNIMVGDFERIVEYAKAGLQREQVIPESVSRAWQNLVDAGFSKHRLVQ